MQSEGGDRGYERWNVKDGYLYFWRTPINIMIVGRDTFTIEQDPSWWKKWVNLVKYDYKTDEVLWSNVIAAGLPWSGGLVFPLYMGLDIDDSGNAYVSIGKLPSVYVLGQDSLHVGEYSSDHSVLIVVDTDGEIIRTDVVDGRCLLVVVKTIGDDSYLLIQTSSDEIYYRGVEIAKNDSINSSRDFVIKVDKLGEY